MKYFLLVLLWTPLCSFGQFVINEASNSNGSTFVTNGGSSPDWLELYNPSVVPISLQDYYLSDDAADLMKWKFPNYTLLGFQYLPVLANGASDTIVVDHYETAVYAGGSWQYFIPSSNMVADWNTNIAAPVSWTNAALGIGYGDGDDQTTVPNGTLSVYVRKVFNIANVTAIENAILDIDYDDGFVAYLNGVEIARSGLVGNPPSWNELSSDHEAQLYAGGSMSEFTIDNATIQSAIVNGQNILAIEVHNANAGSSDLSLIPYLTFGFNEPTLYYGGIIHPNFNSQSSSLMMSTNFSLTSGGETIYLTNSIGVIIDSLVVPDLEPDHSCGKLTDGTATNFIFTTPTPGSTNNISNGYLGYESAPIITTEGGFNAGPISVTITNTSVNGGQIRYTTDGSLPTATSTLYGFPIPLNANTVVRASCISTDPQLLNSVAVAETYLFMEDFTIPVISITTDPTNLYGPTGIFDNHWTDWRKPCNIEYFDADGVKQFETRASIKPDGGAGGSRSNPQHSVTIEPAHSLYGEGEPVHYPLIPEKSFINDFYAFYLRNGSNYWNQYPQKDATFMRIMRETNANSQAYSPVVAYVNGQYFGVYELREKANEGYFETNYGNDRDSLDLLSVSYFYGAGILRTVKGSDTGFYNMKNFIQTYDPFSADYFEKCHEQLDLHNFTDYLSAENWFANFDWIYNNMKIARTRTFDNKWRFFLQDMELGLGGWSDFNSNLFDYFEFNNQPNPYWDIYSGLMQNTEFRNYFINRYADLMNTVYKPTYFQPIVQSMYAQLLPEMPRHFQLWTGDVTGGMNTFLANRNNILNQMSNRNAVVRNQMVTEYGLNEQVDVTLAVNPPGAGYIKISTIVPQTLPWTGVYFDGNPVRMTAVANPGFTFSNWGANTLISGATVLNQSIELNVANDDLFEAFFIGSSAPLELTISEIQYNPDLTVDGGNWIELYNYGSNDIDLTGWQLKSKQNWDEYNFEDQTVIPGGSFLVVCEDTVAFKNQYPTVTNFVGATSFPWGNKIDSIQLYNAFQQLVVMADYKDGAPFPECADGWGRSLENRQYQNSQLDSSVWFCGCIGGSPGKAYEICVEPVQFTEVNYNNISFEKNAGDWFEVRNQSNTSINLSGYTFKDSKNDHVYNLPSVSIEPGEFLAISNDLVLFENRHGVIDNVEGTFSFGLAPKDVLRLYDENGILVTSALYDNVDPWPIQPSVEDYTLEYNYMSGYVDPNSASSWFVGCEGGSPGRAYSPCPILPNGEELFLYPNPTYNVINIVFDNSSNSSNVTEIALFDAQGKIVATRSVDSFESKVGVIIDVNFLAAGVYYVRMQQAGNTIQKPFVKL